MKFIKNYECDREPTNEEIRTGMNIANEEDCIVNLNCIVNVNWFFNIVVGTK